MELSKEIETLISDAIHDVCEECFIRQHCNKPCFEVVRMRQLAEDVVKVERERCMRLAQEWYCKDRCAGYNACKAKYQGKCSMTDNIRKAIEKGGNENERQIES